MRFCVSFDTEDENNKAVTPLRKTTPLVLWVVSKNLAKKIRVQTCLKNLKSPKYLLTSLKYQFVGTTGICISRGFPEMEIFPEHRIFNFCKESTTDVLFRHKTLWKGLPHHRIEKLNNQQTRIFPLKWKLIQEFKKSWAIEREEEKGVCSICEAI